MSPQEKAIFKTSIDISSDALAGRLDAKDAARRLIELGIALIPVEELKPYLSDEARATIDAVIDEMRAAKDGGG